MTGEKGKAGGVRRATLSAADAAKQLGVAEDRLAVFTLQGRLEAWGEEEGQRFGVKLPREPGGAELLA
jgi:hypothetical protein